MTEIAPVLYVSGNHEADLPADIRTKLKAILRRQHITDLDDRRTTRGGVTFAGLALPSEYYRGGGALGFRGAKRCTAKTLRQHLGACEPNTILLAHDPLQFPAYAEWGAMLTVSGHVHGGAVRLPWLGGLLSPERKFFPRYSKGSYTQDGRHLVVSGGLGKLRLFNPPEIRLIIGIEN